MPAVMKGFFHCVWPLGTPYSVSEGEKQKSQ